MQSTSEDKRYFTAYESTHDGNKKSMPRSHVEVVVGEDGNNAEKTAKSQVEIHHYVTRAIKNLLVTMARPQPDSRVSILGRILTVIVGSTIIETTAIGARGPDP